MSSRGSEGSRGNKRSRGHTGRNEDGSRWPLSAVLILIAGIALRFVALGQQSFWRDEIHSILRALGGEDGSLIPAITDIHGPFYFTLLRGWIELLGQSEVAVRALSAVLGSVGLVLFYQVALRRLGRRTALFALALLAASPYYLWYSQEGRNYALFFDVGLLAVVAFVAEVDRRSVKTFGLALIATVLACLSNLSGFFLLPLQGLVALHAIRTRRYSFWRLVIFMVVAVAVLSPWLLRSTQETGEVHLGRPGEGSGVAAVQGEAPPGFLSIPFTFYNFSLGTTMGPSVEELKIHRWPVLLPHLWYLVPCAGLFGWMALLGLRSVYKSKGPFTLLLLWTAVPVLMMAAVAMLNLKAPNARYASLALAPYFLLIAAGVAGIGNRVARYVILGLLLLIAAYSDVQYFTNSRYWRPDARGAGALIDEQARETDGVALYSLEGPLNYYVNVPVEIRKPMPRHFVTEQAMQDWLEAFLQDKERLWIVQCHGWWMDREDRFLKFTQRIMIPEEEWHFPGVPVYLFEKPDEWPQTARKETR